MAAVQSGTMHDFPAVARALYTHFGAELADLLRVLLDVIDYHVAILAERLADDSDHELALFRDGLCDARVPVNRHGVQTWPPRFFGVGLRRSVAVAHGKCVDLPGYQRARVEGFPEDVRDP